VRSVFTIDSDLERFIWKINPFSNSAAFTVSYCPRTGNSILFSLSTASFTGRVQISRIDFPLFSGSVRKFTLGPFSDCFFKLQNQGRISSCFCKGNFACPAIALQATASQFVRFRYARPGRVCAGFQTTWTGKEVLKTGLLATYKVDRRSLVIKTAAEWVLPNQTTKLRFGWDSKERWMVGLHLSPIPMWSATISAISGGGLKGRIDCEYGAM
jgi:hypothetical protein